MTASGHRECCDVGDSVPDELNCCCVFMSAWGTWRTSAWGKLGVVTWVALARVRRRWRGAQNQSKLFGTKGPWEEGGPWGRWVNLAANTVLLLFLFAAQEWRPCPTTPRCTTTTPISWKTRAVMLRRSTTTKLLSSKCLKGPVGLRPCGAACC